MNANRFNAYDLFSWNKYDITFDIIDNLIKFEYIDKGPVRMLTLCMLGPLRHAWLFFPSSSSSMLPPSLLGVDCLNASCLGGLALPHPLPLSWPHFPQAPGNALLLCQAQLCIIFICKLPMKVTVCLIIFPSPYLHSPEAKLGKVRLGLSHGAQRSYN